jgi:GTP cyclohydrolase I
MPIEDIVRALLTELGEDPQRDGLRETPRRVAKSMAFLTSGYHTDLATIVNNALFDVDYS